MSALSARLPLRPISPRPPTGDRYLPQHDAARLTPPRTLSDRVGPPGFRSPSTVSVNPSSISDQDNRPPLVLSPVDERAPRPKEVPRSPLPTRPPPPVGPRGDVVKRGPPEPYHRYRRDEDEERSWAAYQRRRQQQWDDDGRTRLSSPEDRYERDRNWRGTRDDPRPRWPPRDRSPPRRPRSPAPRSFYTSTEIDRSTPSDHSSQIEKRARERSREPARIGKSPVTHSVRPPTPTPSSSDNARPHHRLAIPTGPRDRHPANIPTQPRQVHTERRILSSLILQTQPDTDKPVYIKQELKEEYEVKIEEEVIQEAASQGSRAEPLAQAEAMQPTPPETPESQAAWADRTNRSSCGEQSQLGEDVRAASSPSLNAPITDPAPNDAPPQSSPEARAESHPGDVEPEQALSDGNYLAPVAKPRTLVEEATHIPYENFKHFFDIVVPANYPDMSTRTKRAWRRLQVANAVCRDSNGEPTRLVRIGRLGRRGARKLRIYWTAIRNAGVISGRAFPDIATRKAPGRRVRQSVASGTPVASEVSRDPSPPPSGPSAQAQGTSIQATREPASGLAQQSTPIYGPLPNLKFTASGQISMRSIRKEDVPYISYIPLPEDYLACETPQTMTLHKKWVKVQKAKAERKKANGMATRLIKTLGRVEDDYVILWRPLYIDDDMIDAFSGQKHSTRPGAQPRVPRKRKRSLQSPPSIVESALDTNDELGRQEPSPSPSSEITAPTTEATEPPINYDDSEEDVPLCESHGPKVRRKRVIETCSPSRSPSTVPSDRTVTANDAAPLQNAVAVPEVKSLAGDLRETETAPSPKVCDSEPVRVSEVKTTPQAEDNGALSRLQSALLDALSDIDRWTELLERRPESSSIIGKQLKRTQDEVFRLDAEIEVLKASPPTRPGS